MAHVPRYLLQRGLNTIYAFPSYKTGANTTRIAAAIPSLRQAPTETEPVIDFPEAVQTICAQFRDEAYRIDHFRPWLSRGSHRARREQLPFRSALAPRPF